MTAVPPGVGGPTSDHRAVCAYTGSVPDGPTVCNAAATRHLMVQSPAWGVVGLLACDAHLRIARAAGIVLGEHEFMGLCGLPGTAWTDERCVIDDSGLEPALAGTREMAHADA